MYIMNTLSIFQIILSIILVGLILLQRPITDAGALGSSDAVGGHTKRGVEKTIHYITLAVAIAFAASTAVPLFFK